MKETEIIVVRIYITEASKLLEKLLRYLKDEAKVRGVTVFRGICGYGEDKILRTSSLVDLSLDLPLVLEFFDESGKAKSVIKHLAALIKPEHIVFWNASFCEIRDDT